MPKIFDRPNSELGFGVRRINEDIWFVVQQKLLLWMANTPEGRALLCIPKEYPRIIEISKKHIKMYLGTWGGRDHFMSDFRIGAKWANTIRHRWFDFQKMAQWYYFMNRMTPMMPVAPSHSLRYTTTTVYPDPNPETTTVDGKCRDASADNRSWATVRNAAGSDKDDSSAFESGVQIGAGTTSNTWEYIARGFFLYDTSSIPDTDMVDSATLSLYGHAKSDTLGSTPNINIYTSNPASNTALVASDYATVGDTAQCDTAVTYAGWSSAAYNDFAFNATGLGNISKTGVSKFSSRNASYDVANSAPTWASSNPFSNIQVEMAETASTTKDPKLVVIHSAAATGQYMSLNKRFW